ncbi:MAG: hypothetical protein O3C63_06845 [Cyanobacteria bacterium]|nr:hypothetical protein [Cyanobacteriota bacterium]MDA1021716.1 hypothetical protein [Cyanobacteriota bacterium]
MLGTLHSYSEANAELDQGRIEFRRCFVTSHECNAEKILETACAHWGVENSLHWVLGVASVEDDSKIDSKNTPFVMSALCKIGVNFVKADKDSKRGFKKR